MGQCGKRCGVHTNRYISHLCDFHDVNRHVSNSYPSSPFILLRHFRLARELEPGYCEPAYWIGITLVNMGRSPGRGSV